MRASAATASTSAAVEMLSAGDELGQFKDECVADGGGGGRDIVYRFRLVYFREECELGLLRPRLTA